MRLTSFSVENYKVFKGKFNVGLSKGNIVILTGRNNTGKSTVLEAINHFYQNETKAKTIPNDCFSNLSNPITMYATFEVESSDQIEEITLKKVYNREMAPKFYDADNNEIKKSNDCYEFLQKIFENKPFYITPAMLPEDVHTLIQDIYKEIILSTLTDLTTNDTESPELKALKDEYDKIKQAYPRFLKQIKDDTDQKLSTVSKEVSGSLQSLFGSPDLDLKVVGGESQGFSPQDILKTTTSEIEIGNDKKPQMPLENQGTGLQRMSLIYLIQQMISAGLFGGQRNKLLLIDEPEAFLHPSAVRALSRSLYEIGRGMPLVISSHSPVLINLSEQHSLIQVFRVKSNKAIELYKTEKAQFTSDDFENLKILNYADSYVNEFFFNDEILIVEGDTEYILFKHFAEIYNSNIHIIRARGKATIVTLMKILNQFNGTYKVLHDIDNHERYGQQTLKSQLTNCKNILNERNVSANSKHIQVYASRSNFEQAIGLGDIRDNLKTKLAFHLTQENLPDNYRRAYAHVEDLFLNIIGETTNLSSKHKFMLIENEEQLTELFEPLINEVEPIKP